jgi:hypothetical protein
MGANSDYVQCAGGILGQHSHICAFFHDLDEQHRVLRSFKDGLDINTMILEVLALTRTEMHRNGVSLRPNSRRTCRAFKEIESSSNK